jgi:hypothetical protein
MQQKVFNFCAAIVIFAMASILIGAERAARQQGISLAAYLVNDWHDSNARIDARIAAANAEKAAAAAKHEEELKEYSEGIFNSALAEAKQRCKKDLGGYSTMEQCVTENTVINENVTLYDGIRPD